MEKSRVMNALKLFFSFYRMLLVLFYSAFLEELKHLLTWGCRALKEFLSHGVPPYALSQSNFLAEWTVGQGGPVMR